MDTCSHKIVNVFRRLSGSPQNGRKSWWPFVCASLFCIVFFGYRAAFENAAASREQTSFGIIGQCEHRGRGNENYCDYTFSVGDEQYTAVNKAGQQVGFGQTVTVYYDSEDPQVSALEDFSIQSLHDLNFVYVFVGVLAAGVAFVLWDRAPFEETSDEHAS